MDVSMNRVPEGFGIELFGLLTALIMHSRLEIRKPKI
jgi:hypothetical protein